MSVAGPMSAGSTHGFTAGSVPQCQGSPLHPLGVKTTIQPSLERPFEMRFSESKTGRCGDIKWNIYRLAIRIKQD